MTLVRAQGDALVAVGQSGTTFRAWRFADGALAAGRAVRHDQGPCPERAGRRRPSPPASPPPGSVLRGGDGRLGVPALRQRRRRAGLAPADRADDLPAGTGTGVALAGVADGGAERVLLATDDGAGGRVFLADLPA